MASERPTILNVANRLPVTVGEDEIRKSSGGLVAALEGVGPDRFSLRWIGWPGAAIPEERHEQVRKTLDADYHATPVFLSDKQAEGFYEGFANSSLWPLLHYMPSRFRYKSRWWDAYREVNQLFADQVAAAARPGDLVWVHDYQLMLLPRMLRDARPDLKIGYFLHTPFPSYEVFRCHPRRSELLDGLLGADRIGFHTFGYLRHFRSSVLRLLGIESELTHIRSRGMISHLGVYPIGINAGSFDRELSSPAFAGRLREFVANHKVASLNAASSSAANSNAANSNDPGAKAAERKVVVSVERLDYTKGILRRLDAIDLFLARHPDRDRIRFIFVSVPSRENVKEYRTLREDVEACVGRLNGKYATLHNSPIHFIHGSVQFPDLCALYAMADACIVTPLIDGMNLVAKEYVACQRGDVAGAAAPEVTRAGHAKPSPADSGPAGPGGGALILSEFAGAAEELFNALIVNPYDAGAVADAIGQALEMPAEEKRERMRPMRERVMKFDAGWWARTFIDDLSRVEPDSGANTDVGGARRQLAEAVSAGKRVALFLDYDGTLREIEREPSAAGPGAAVRATLQRFVGRPNLSPWVISGRRAEELEAWLGGFGIGLIAEHGAALRRPGGQWEQLDRNVNYAWKEELLRLLRVYADSTPGSFVETKRTGLVWHYRKADPEFGAWKANELADELAALTASDPVRVRHGRKIVEITAAEINKGAAVTRVAAEGNFDLILAAGDDLTDETMFHLHLPGLLTIKVGPGDTAAAFRVDTPAAFRLFLEQALGGG